MPDLNKKVNEIFPGKVVRKDLERRKLLFLERMLPMVERNYNLIE